MSPQSDSHFREIFLRLFPWLSRLGISTATRALEVKSAGNRLELEGGGLAVARKTDTCGRLYRDATSGALYYSPDATADYVIVASAAGPPVNGAVVGTPIAIATGSENVTCS